MQKGVLVTRPAPLAASLCKALRKQGRFAYAFPCLAFEQVHLLKNLPQKETIQGALIVIVTSQHAVAYAPKKLWEQCKVAAYPVALVALGQATAEALTAKGLAVTLTAPQGATSEWLLSQSLLTAVQGRSCIVVTGEHSRTVLEETLSKREAAVTLFEVYRRVRPRPLVHDWEYLGSQTQLIVASSFQGLMHLFDLVPKAFHVWLRCCHWIVPSRRIQTLACQRFALQQEQFFISEGVGKDAILRALEKVDPLEEVVWRE